MQAPPVQLLATVLIAGSICMTRVLAQAGSIVSPAPAQTSVTVPFPGIGDRQFSLPLFRWLCPGGTPQRWQTLFRVPGAIPSPMRSVAFRRHDVAATASVAIPAFEATVNLWVGHSPNTPASPGLRFSSNTGPDYTQVATQKRIRFAAEPWRPANDYGMNYLIPFDVPFGFVPGRTGLIDLEVLDSTYCAQNGGDPGWEGYRDASIPYPGDPLYPAQFGSSCGPLGVPNADNYSITSIVLAGNPGVAILFPEFASGPNCRAVFFAGASNTTFAGLQLPFPLGPLGAPACTLYSSLDLELPRITNGNSISGTDYAELSPPNDPRLVGAFLYVQAFRVDPTANPLGLWASNGTRVGIAAHADPVMSLLMGPEYSLSAGADGAQRIIGAGPVFELDGR